MASNSMPHRTQKLSKLSPAPHCEL